jgi:Purple acid Phosphatase, N-terminal domain/Calcineurin-like phosphoesterase
MTSTRMTPEQAKRLSLAEQHDWFRRATSRRSLLRGGVIGAGALAAGPALLSGTAGAATTSRRATPMLLTSASVPNGATVPAFGRHVAYGADPTTQMAVAWQVPALVSSPFLRVGPSPSDLSGPIPAEIRTLTTPVSDTVPVDSVSINAPPDVVQYYLHARVDGLQPGQTYYYSIGHQNLDALNAVGTFTTAPQGRVPFRFTAFGDHGVTYDAVATDNLINAQNPAFHLHAGDISYAESGGSGLLTDPYDPRIWDAFFIEFDSVSGHIPWQVAVGNHEMEAWYSPDGYGGQYARFDFPGEVTSSTPPTYYSFIYSNVGVVSLDANDVSFEIPADLGYTDGAQTAWLNTTLAALRSNPQVDFIVAYFHHCAYSTCTTHGCEGGVQKYWTPLFDQYQVDLVINGHNHIFERTDPIIAGSPTEVAPIGATIYPAKDGTTYVCAGAGGVSLYKFSAPDSYEGDIDNVSSEATFVNEYDFTTKTSYTVPETVTWSRVRYTGYNLLVVDSTPGYGPSATSSLLVRGLDEYGAELDRFTLVR